MNATLLETKMERAVAAARAEYHESGGLAAHLVIDDLIGMDAYRRFMGCPDSETLTAYAEDGLPLDAALPVAAHESRCPVCRADVADLRGCVLQQTTPLYAALSAWATPFTGRAEIREALGARLARGDGQTLTLSAPPGMGKTRLMLETAVERSYLFPDGVWYVPMTGAGDADRMAAQIARAAQLPLRRTSAPLEQLRAFFADKRALLVLDDVPARSAAADALDELMRAAPDLRCMTTTAGAHRLAGEGVLSLPPLQTSPGTRDPERALSSESVQMFAARVRALQPGYDLDERDALAAADLCLRAAGTPLGIELAAGQALAMPPEEILRRLGPRAASPDDPIESLGDLMAFSYGLLSTREQRFLQRLSVFAEGCFAEQAAAVCEDDDAPQILESLREKAMVQRVEVLSRARYELLTPVRNFARKRLGAQEPETRRRHLACFLHYSQERAERIEGPQQIAAIQEISADLPNIRAGMDAALEAEAWSAAGGFGLSLRRTLFWQGFWPECAERLRAAAAAFARAGDAAGREKAQRSLAAHLAFLGENAESEEILKALLADAEARGDKRALAETRYCLGYLAQYPKNYAEAAAQFSEAMALFETLGDRPFVGDCLQNLGYAAWKQKDYERAERLLTQSLEIERERGDRYRIGNTLGCLGSLALEQGRMEEARPWLEEALQLRHELGDARGIASVIDELGQMWRVLGDRAQTPERRADYYARADYCFSKAARDFERLGDRRDLANVLLRQAELRVSVEY